MGAVGVAAGAWCDYPSETAQFFICEGFF